MVRADGCQIGCFDGVCLCSAPPTPELDGEGRRVFPAQGGGRGLVVVEGRPGTSGFPPGVELAPAAGGRPDLQILSSMPLGDGSTEVCDRGPAPPQGDGGGIPAVDPPDFNPDQRTTDALNDLACRFAVQPTRDEACTLDILGNFAFLSSDSTIQYCYQVSDTEAFPPGDTVLTIRLRDVNGHLGPAAQVVIRNLVGSSAAAAVAP